MWVCLCACVCACVSAEMLMPLYQMCTPVYSAVCVSVSLCVCASLCWCVCVCEACVSVFSHAFRPFIKRSKRCFRFFYVLHRAKVFFTLLLLSLWASQDRKFNGKKSGKEIWQPGFYTTRLRPNSSSSSISSVCGAYYVETK